MVGGERGERYAHGEHDAQGANGSDHKLRLRGERFGTEPKLRR
jgi:hypothetical protein